LAAPGAKVVGANPTQVKLIAESRRKTGKIDAKVFGELLRLDGLPHPVHMPGWPTRALRGLLVARRQLVTARTKISDVVGRMLRQEGSASANGRSVKIHVSTTTYDLDKAYFMEGKDGSASR
jgi:transposase